MAIEPMDSLARPVACLLSNDIENRCQLESKCTRDLTKCSYRSTLHFYTRLNDSQTHDLRWDAG